MNKKTLWIIIGVVLLSIYYCLLFYVAKVWYSNIPAEVLWLMESGLYNYLLPTAYVIVPAHLIAVTILAYKRVINPGQIVLLFMVPIAMGYFIFPAKG